MSNPTDKLAIRYEREQYEQESEGRMLAKTVRILAEHPLTPEHHALVAEHLTTLPWTDEQYAALDKVLILIATGGQPKPEDIKCLLTREDVETVIERELRKPLHPKLHN